mgnify:CR=1 FL=1
MSPSAPLSRRRLFFPPAFLALLLGPLIPLAHARPETHGAGELVVTARSGLVVRSGPGSGYRSLGALEPGARVAPTGAQGAWKKLRFQGREGWVHTRYLRAAEPAEEPEEPAPPPAEAPGTAAGGGNVVDALEGRAAAPGEAEEEESDAAGEGAGESVEPPAVDPETLPRSRAGFVQLPAAGPGFGTYSPARDRWGTPTMVYGLLRVGQRWAGRGPRMMVGDISLQSGGKMPGHASHRRGVDADLRPVRNDGQEGPVEWRSSAYSRPLTLALLKLFREVLPVERILFNDPQAPHTRRCKGHDNHFHVRTRR